MDSETSVTTARNLYIQVTVATITIKGHKYYVNVAKVKF